MKITIDVDCSPEEARRFMGLPDLGPVHEAYLDKMKKAVADGNPAELFSDMVKGWAPMNEAGMNVWAQMFDQVSGKK